MLNEQVWEALLTPKNLILHSFGVGDASHRIAFTSKPCKYSSTTDYPFVRTCHNQLRSKIRYHVGARCLG